MFLFSNDKIQKFPYKKLILIDQFIWQLYAILGRSEQFFHHCEDCTVVLDNNSYQIS